MREIERNSAKREKYKEREKQKKNEKKREWNKVFFSDLV